MTVRTPARETWLRSGVLAGYALLLVGASAAIGLRRRCAEAVLLPAVAATIHLAWAAGFFAGAPRGAGGKGR